MTEPDRAVFLSEMQRSEHALLAALTGLTDEQARAASALPGWTRGHLLTHLARNAETFAEVIEGAGRGETLAMYGGSAGARNAGIERGAARSAAELVADVRDTSTRLLAALPEADWSAPVRHLRGTPLTVADVPTMRRQEVEIHRVDLDLGYTPAQWPEDFVAVNLPRQLQRLPERAPGVHAPELAAHAVLAWLYGRGEPGLPELPPWP